jgi:two-component system, cell cycle response regulator DivK
MSQRAAGGDLIPAPSGRGAIGRQYDLVWRPARARFKCAPRQRLDVMARILYIEDTENNRILVTRQLERRGYQVLTAEDAQSGLALALAEPPDLVLMDMGLPDVDGWEATRRLRANPRLQHIPVIALTAHVMQGDRESSLAAGCDDYDTKPFQFPRLIGKIEALLAARQATGGSAAPPTSPADS